MIVYFWEIYCILKSCKTSLCLYVRGIKSVDNYKQVFLVCGHTEVLRDKSNSLCVGLSCIAGQSASLVATH